MFLIAQKQGLTLTEPDTLVKANIYTLWNTVLPKMQTLWNSMKNNCPIKQSYDNAFTLSLFLQN